VRRCGRCGAEAPGDAVYCYNCGARLPRRRFLKALIPAILLAALFLAMLTPASPLNQLLRPPGRDISEMLRSLGFNASATPDGYVHITLDSYNILELSGLEQALKDVDARWVILTNNAAKTDPDRAEMLSGLAMAVEGVEGAWSHDGVLLVTVYKYSAQQLHTLFRLAGEDIKLYVRFTDRRA
jgi:hypothetical protein